MDKRTVCRRNLDETPIVHVCINPGQCGIET
jgi:hypothetical protein